MGASWEACAGVALLARLGIAGLAKMLEGFGLALCTFAVGPLLTWVAEA
jgi:hypothetical protein